MAITTFSVIPGPTNGEITAVSTFDTEEGTVVYETKFGILKSKSFKKYTDTTEAELSGAGVVRVYAYHKENPTRRKYQDVLVK